jgi:hypothetical protein
LPACDDDGGGSPADAAAADLGTPDAVTPDAATPDASTPDAVTPDAATPDAAAPDAATPDAATPDAAAPDAATPDGAAPDAAPQGLCGADMAQALEAAVEGLFYLSESDYPFGVVVAPDDGAGPIPADVARALDPEAMGAGEVRDFGALFDRFTNTDDPELNRRFAALRAVLESNLSDLAVYRFNPIEVRVLILGRTVCGEIAGVTSISVET